MREVTGSFEGKGGTRLFYRHWLLADQFDRAPQAAGGSSSPQDTVILIHGSGEHSGRYESLAQFLVSSGFQVAAPDLRGLGQSGGLKGHVQAFADYLVDLSFFLQLIRSAGTAFRAHGSASPPSGETPTASGLSGENQGSSTRNQIQASSPPSGERPSSGVLFRQREVPPSEEARAAAIDAATLASLPPPFPENSPGGSPPARPSPPARFFLYGHSLGGLIALGYALNHPEDLAGVIVSSPALGLAMKVSPLKTALGQLASRYLPTLRLDSGIPSRYLSRNPEIGLAYDRDPLVYRKVSTRWYTEFVGAMQEFTRRADKLRTPVLFLQAGDDRLVSPAATESFFRACGSPDKTFKLYPGAYHEVHNDPVAEEASRDLLDWLQQRVAR